MTSVLIFGGRCYAAPGEDLARIPLRRWQHLPPQIIRIQRIQPEHSHRLVETGRILHDPWTDFRGGHGGSPKIKNSYRHCQ